jgi:hypothetical protein
MEVIEPNMSVVRKRDKDTIYIKRKGEWGGGGGQPSSSKDRIYKIRCIEEQDDWGK